MTRPVSGDISDFQARRRARQRRNSRPTVERRSFTPTGTLAESCALGCDAFAAGVLQIDGEVVRVCERCGRRYSRTRPAIQDQERDVVRRLCQRMNGESGKRPKFVVATREQWP